ncbi:thioesterase [Pseudoflavitalea sp. X16]|uniref:acyl-CoA thioesterase n=1 Tax=Paraflavitalea devenefica TaxID=2716334 RepID=UPI001421DD8C|nr:acyl-CoA thioesterase [Paraflavitalea devenefica]NII29838.1 thioesterase [Paraflavitalea devenefica]
MSSYIKTVEVRWADLDPNFHLRHSVYYDYGAYCRIAFLEAHGLTAAFMAQNHFGPILFREECVFRKEIRLDDVVTIDLRLLKAREDQSRWGIQHHIYKNSDTLAAILTVEGAWINTQLRKLAAPPEPVLHVFNNMPRAEEFEWMK